MLDRLHWISLTLLHESPWKTELLDWGCQLFHTFGTGSHLIIFVDITVVSDSTGVVELKKPILSSHENRSMYEYHSSMIQVIQLEILWKKCLLKKITKNLVDSWGGQKIIHILNLFSSKNVIK